MTGIGIVIRPFALLFVVSFGVSFGAMPSTVNVAKNHMPDCGGACDGNRLQWATWTDWDECKWGECHEKLGRQSRQNICYKLGEEPQSENKWIATCRQKEDQACVQERTCAGKWSTWGTWTKCTMSGNATCIRHRQRLCHNDLKERLVASLCYGGLSGDYKQETCSNQSCTRVLPTIPSVETEKQLNPEQSVNNNGREKKGLSHNTILIIAVAIGSLVFAAVFVLLILNLVRRTSTRDDNSISSRSDRFKRIGSTNTSSTGYSAGYVAASEILSPRTEVFTIRSPSSTTTVSGSSSASQQFFGRNDTRSPPTSENIGSSGLLKVCGNKEGGERSRRSRLLQENVYWEITDANSLSFEDEESSPFGEITRTSRERDDQAPEEVQNVLYGRTV